MHVRADRQFLSKATRRGKQGCVPASRRAWSASRRTRFRRRHCCRVVPGDAAKCGALARSAVATQAGDAPVWSLSCLYVRKAYRRQGITSHLIAAALDAARRANAHALEAYPFDADVSPSASGSGYASTFARAGFRVVARRVPSRPMMRYDFKQNVDDGV
ncbi:GNAT family N-acetyltransferase [Mesorhizobium ventifaucium]|uniref:GNAT family N-acetyltransferase n=1 Tax=Mesorhizobium ventifaucium TaxID=666020 RepID=UPI003F52D73D